MTFSSHMVEKMLDKKIIMCGCAEYGIYLLTALVEAGYKISYLVALSPEQALKYNISGYADFRPVAARLNIPIYVPKTYTLRHPDDINFFNMQNFDVIIPGGWQRLFPEAILKSLKIGAIGVHGSADFLPKGRGRSPLNWSIIEGKRRFLVHIFFIKPGVDDGDVLGVDDFDINEFDDIETLYLKSSIALRRLLLQHMPAILSGTVIGIPQVGAPTYYQKRTPDDGRIDWEVMDVHYLHNFIRALTRPYPGAFGVIDERNYKIWRARPFDTRITYPHAHYGEVVERFGTKVVLNCRGGLLLIDEYEDVS